jgi:hypothetical protein
MDNPFRLPAKAHIPGLQHKRTRKKKARLARLKRKRLTPKTVYDNTDVFDGKLERFDRPIRQLCTIAAEVKPIRKIPPAPRPAFDRNGRRRITS